MTELNPNRMIPLRVADQAVAACEREIADLKAEVERLKKFNDEASAHIAKEERKSRERLEMAEAEVERLRKAGEWLPIETAPTGIQILLYSKDFCMIEGSVCDKTDPTDASEELLTLDHNGDDLYGMTHWMPLPQPPAAKDGKPTE